MLEKVPFLKENSYTIAEEAKNASIFGIGNGYFGIRGSLEEFGDVIVQGCYVRGVFDSIIEIPQTLSDNSYMKRYYFDEQKLKEFEKEDSCINVGDPTAFRIYIGGRLYLPWEYRILNWDRHIDYRTGGLVRDVEIEDEKGNRTRLSFQKVASFSNQHLLLQTLVIKKVNHNLPIEVRSGVDLLVKTNGQKKARLMKKQRSNGRTDLDLSFGDKYGHKGRFSFRSEAKGFSFMAIDDGEELYSDRFVMEGSEGKINKVLSFYASVDPDWERGLNDPLPDISFKGLMGQSEDRFSEIFHKVDIKIDGNDEMVSLMRWANYQTLIGFNFFDSVHSLSAKNLTSEKYNQFVWWDAEIYQIPFFLAHFPREVRNAIEYRYKTLPGARENAKKECKSGAKYAFCSSVTGEEQVWIYAKHPFLQIHINSDVAYGILNYYRHTLDKRFMLEKGFPMIEEILLFFHSRSTLVNGKYHLLCVTGTDEHHDYVNDDAYTNYALSYVLKEFLRLSEKLSYAIEAKTKEIIECLSEKLYLPPFDKGIMPQFEGYLTLDPNLPLEGSGQGKASSFQMKQSGLYHLSQIIKQPDVLLLYANLDIGFESHYEENYRFYLSKCEASSSLTFPTHAIAAADNQDMNEFHANLMKCLTVDIDDIFGAAYQGLHAGSIAGAHLAIYRGLLGIRIEEDYFRIDPKIYDKVRSLSLNFDFHGNTIDVHYTPTRVSFSSARPFNVLYRGQLIKQEKQIVIDLKEEKL